MNEKVWKIGYLYILVSSLNMTSIANAACTPTPDCASIGYTETSCETDYLACPFDNTKLKCMPCDSTYRYNCIDENITKGIGDTCDGKYTSCECEVGTIFVNGNCICDISCNTIGNIVYSDKSCSSCYLPNKIAVAIIVHADTNNSLITPITAPILKWYPQFTDIPSLNNISTIDEAILDMNGYNNTQLIVKYVEENEENIDKTQYAPLYCNHLKVDGFDEYNKQWYLPSAGELYKYFSLNYNLIKNTLSKLSLSSFLGWQWSSTESTYASAWHIDTTTDKNGVRSKTNAYPTSCLLRIKLTP